MISKKPNKTPKYICEGCDFKTNHINDFAKHNLTRKHLNNNNLLKNPTLEKRGFVCACGKSYSYQSGLSYHKKKCSEALNAFEDEQEFDEEELQLVQAKLFPLPDLSDKGIMKEILQQNAEFKEMLIDQNHKMLELMSKNSAANQIITNNNKTINNNTQFNLNFFLNEKCKDAMNIYQFMESIKIQLDDLDYTGANGYVAGVSRIFLRELKKLDVCKRPIHCTDVKREVFHVKNKDNHWGRERNLLITTIKEITRKNVVHLNEWRDAYPGCMDYFNKKNDQYLKIQSEILGSADSEEDMKYYNKIIASLAKETMVDKKISAINN